MRRDLAHELFGFYLALLGFLKVALYWNMQSDPNGPLFYFDPRIGIFALGEMLRLDPVVGRFTAWLSAAILIGIGGLQFLGRNMYRVYITFETICALPSVFFFGVVVVVNLGPAHGFSRQELQLPLLVFLFFTVLPMIWAIRLRRSNADSEHEAPAN